MNKIILIGNLTKDPECMTTANGLNVCKFTLAVPRKYKSASGEKEVDFINIVVWRGLADNCEKYLKKGFKCAVSGSMQIRSYDKDGERRYITEVVADDITFLTFGANEKTESEELEPITDVKLPF